MKWRLLRRNTFRYEKIPQQEPPLHARSSSIPRIRIWPIVMIQMNTKFIFGTSGRHSLCPSLTEDSCTTLINTSINNFKVRNMLKLHAWVRYLHDCNFLQGCEGLIRDRLKAVIMKQSTMERNYAISTMFILTHAGFCKNLFLPNDISLCLISLEIS